MSCSSQSQKRPSLRQNNEFFDALNFDDPTFKKLEMKRGEYKKFKDFTLDDLTEPFLERTAPINFNHIPQSTFYDACCSSVQKKILNKMPFFDIFSYFFKTSIVRDDRNAMLKMVTIRKHQKLVIDLKKPDKMEYPYLTFFELYSYTPFFDHFIFPPQLKNLLDFLYVIRNFYLDLKVIFNYPDFNKELKGVEFQTNFIELKYSAKIMFMKFNHFYNKFNAFLYTNILYRHYGNHEFRPINYDYIHFIFYSFFVEIMFQNNLQHLTDFIQQTGYIQLPFHVALGQNPEKTEYRLVKFTFLDVFPRAQDFGGKKALRQKDQIFQRYLKNLCEFLRNLHSHRNDLEREYQNHHKKRSVISRMPTVSSSNHSSIMKRDVSTLEVLGFDLDETFMRNFPCFYSWDISKNPFPDFEQLHHHLI